MKKSSLLIASLTMALPLAANATAPDTSKYNRLLQQVGERLENNYVFPEVGKKYRQQLQLCLSQSCLADLDGDKAVAQKVTELLQSIYPDKHLRLYAPGQREEMQKRRKMKKKKAGKKVADASGIVETKVLADNIGYMKINLFPGNDKSIAATHEAMKKLKDTKAVIFDIREHRGGSPDNITEIANFLFQQETHMVTTKSPYENNGEPVPHMTEPNQYATDYQNKPVYLLTSKRSGSAAEHFAMSMKATGRAILVGETTGGYGHWGNMIGFDSDFTMFLPAGRTFHPVNKLGWEGIGITPDIQTAPEDSLDFTLNRIRALM